jgi:CBS domain-containing protein
MKVADMKGTRKRTVSVAAATSLAGICQTMRDHNVGAVIVSDDGVSVAGIVTERDIVRAVGVTWPTIVNRSAGQLMSSPVLTCSPGDELSRVIQTMLSRRVRHLPVVEQGRLVGMVSQGDVVKNLLEQQQLEVNILRDLYFSASR